MNEEMGDEGITGEGWRKGRRIGRGREDWEGRTDLKKRRV